MITVESLLHKYRVLMTCGHVEDRMMGEKTAGVVHDPEAPWQVESRMDCQDCQKVKAQARAAQLAPVEGQLHVYHPELHEERATSRMLHTRHVWKSFYSVEWKDKDHAAVLALFKRLRVRPCKRGEGKDPIQHNVPGVGGFLGKQAKYSCLVTGAAHDKLHAYASHEMLLD